jgi:hypothetical protein
MAISTPPSRFLQIPFGKAIGKSKRWHPGRHSGTSPVIPRPFSTDPDHSTAFEAFVSLLSAPCMALATGKIRITADKNLLIIAHYDSSHPGLGPIGQQRDNVGNWVRLLSSKAYQLG